MRFYEDLTKLSENRQDQRAYYIPYDTLEKALKVAPDLMPVTCASGDKFVDGGEPKRRLHREYGADIC